MKCLDGIQGPLYVGSGCVFNRQALYGFDPLSDKRPKMKSCCWPSSCSCCSGDSESSSDDESDQELVDFDDEEEEELSFMSLKSLEKRFGQSPVFIASALMKDGGLPKGTNTRVLVKEAIHVISCDYEEKTEWGKEVTRLLQMSYKPFAFCTQKSLKAHMKKQKCIFLMRHLFPL